jgi:hypothetical protein
MPKGMSYSWRYIWRLAKLNRVLNKASDAVTAGDIPSARRLLEQGFQLIRTMKLPATALINAITGTGLIGVRLDELGAKDLASVCHTEAKLLQARLDAGDFDPDP